MAYQFIFSDILAHSGGISGNLSDQNRYALRERAQLPSWLLREKVAPLEFESYENIEKRFEAEGREYLQRQKNQIGQQKSYWRRVDGSLLLAHAGQGSTARSRRKTGVGTDRVGRELRHATRVTLNPVPSDAPASIVAARQAAILALGRRDLRAAFAAVRQLAALRLATGAADSAAQAELGDLWSSLADYAAACASYSEAIKLDPGEPRFWFNRASVQRFLGELAASEDDYDRAIALAPEDAQAYLGRSELRPQTPARNHIPELERALARGPDEWRYQVPLRYALAKEYEDLGDYEASWRHVTAGAALRRQHLQYDLRLDLATVDWICQAFPAGPIPDTGAPSAEPIFILGMPRSGSTLVDRILGSHTQVYSAGELPDFGIAVVAAIHATQAHGRKLSRHELVAGSAAVDFRALGEAYLRHTRPRTGHTPRFTDKLPLNYLYCGLIARALPNARIVHVTRGAMATCHGMYKVLFDRGYPFSYDLRELADYYLGYRKLMSHWAAALPGRIIEVRYERLVADPAAEARRLLEALGLQWEPRCLEFDRNPAPVATASAAQVRRPIYADAVSLWRRYERGLEPLASRLQAGGLSAED